MLHLATISMGIREFIVMYCVRGPKAGKVYIEEAVLVSKDYKDDVTAYCKFIEDDALAYDLAKFAEEKQVIDMKKIANTLFDQGKQQWLMM